MKHGPIALIDDRMPVVAIAPDDHVFEKMIGNMQEAKARGASVIAITLIDRLMHACCAGGDCRDAVGGCSGVDVRAEGASTPLWAQVSSLW